MEPFTISLKPDHAVTMRQMLQLAVEMACQQVDPSIPGGSNPEILEQASRYWDAMKAFDSVWSGWRERNPPAPERDLSEYPWEEVLPPDFF